MSFLPHYCILTLILGCGATFFINCVCKKSVCKIAYFLDRGGGRGGGSRFEPCKRLHGTGDQARGWGGLPDIAHVIWTRTQRKARDSPFEVFGWIASERGELRVKTHWHDFSIERWSIHTDARRIFVFDFKILLLASDFLGHFLLV